jgi:hypothetical protein
VQEAAPTTTRSDVDQRDVGRTGDGYAERVKTQGGCAGNHGLPIGIAYHHTVSSRITQRGWAYEQRARIGTGEISAIRQIGRTKRGTMPRARNAGRFTPKS